MFVIESTMDKRLERETAVIRVEGRLDLYAADTLRGEVQQHVTGGRANLILDLAQVDFIDSSGLGAIVGALKSVRKCGGMLRIAALQAQAQEVMRLTTLDRVIPTFGSVEDALNTA
ncbi:MAG: STAS domain-containing protein [Chloroflexota bacterium]